MKDKAKDQPLEITQNRTIALPASDVYKAWTDPKQLALWWVAKGGKMLLCKVEVIAEGTIQMHIIEPDDAEYPMRGIYHDVERNKLLSFSLYAHDDERKRAGLVMHHTISIDELDGVTTLAVVVRIVRAAPELAEIVAAMKDEWAERVDRLITILHSPPAKKVAKTTKAAKE
jgi:uncharacterized protein YndB with AHSA1/START domain